MLPVVDSREDHALTLDEKGQALYAKPTIAAHRDISGNNGAIRTGQWVALNGAGITATVPSDISVAVDATGGLATWSRS